MKRIIISVLLVAAVASGCGGGSSHETSLEGPSPTPSASPSTEPTAAGIPTDISGFTSASCLAVEEKFSKAASALSPTATAGKESFTDTFGVLADAMSNAADKVDKPDVKAAFALLAKDYKQLASDLKGVSYTPSSGAAPPAAYLNALKAFGGADFLAATKTVTSYFTSGCK